LAVPVVLPFGYLIALKKKEDKDYFQRFGFIMFPKQANKSVWFHCASVGEVRSLKHLSSVFRRRFPDTEIIISTTTATGKNVAEKEIKPFAAFLLPVENFIAIAHIITYMNVKAVVIVDTELWPNLIMCSSKYSKLYLINGRISDKSLRGYKRVSKLAGGLLGRFTYIFTKSDVDTDKFAELKGSDENIITLGNIKYSAAPAEPDLTKIAHLLDKPFIAAASTHRGEEEFTAEAFMKSGFKGRLVIAPRHLNRVSECLAVLKKCGLNPCALTDFRPEADAVVVDMFSQLEALYTKAEKIFVGGSIADVGGHNIFEALQFRKNTITGPNMHNFAEIHDAALRHSVSSVVTTVEELAEKFGLTAAEGDFDSFFAETERSAEERLNGFMEKLESEIAD
jgi:3-deoxy-D-manno-octulosonic-acid transferase